MDTELGTSINTTLSKDNGRYIEILHRTDDPCVWKIRSSKKFLWFRIHSSTSWFMDKQQALNFAKELKDEKQINKKE